MIWRIERAVAVDRDIAEISKFLQRSYMQFGDSQTSASAQAAKRIHGIEQHFIRLAVTPYVGTLHPEVRRGLRSITMDRFVYWFEVTEDESTILIFAIFFGAQDHHSLMRRRLKITK